MTSSPRAAFAAAAEGLCGAPFRLHGRDPATGLDCVGLAAVALERCGRAVVAPAGYALRALSVAPLLACAERNGFVRHDALAPSKTGDLVLLRLSPIQAHLAIVVVGGRFVHAHAGLGRVVVERAPLPGVPIARWRLTAKG